MKSLFVAALSLVAVSVAHAQSETPTPAPPPEATATPSATPEATQAPTPTPPPPVPAWKGSLEAGATETSGNTEIQTYTGAMKVDGTWRGWGVAVRSSGVYAETEDIQTAGAWDASLRGDRALVSILGAYARVSIDGDRFKGIENRKGAGLGLSVAKKWAAREGGYDSAGLRAEGGYQFYREDLVGVDFDNDIHAARVFVALFKAISKDTSISEEAEVLYDFETEGRYLVTSVTALSVRMRRNLALKLSETIKLDTKPTLTDPADPASEPFEKVDTLTALSLQLSF